MGLDGLLTHHRFFKYAIHLLHQKLSAYALYYTLTDLVCLILSFISYSTGTKRPDENGNKAADEAIPGSGIVGGGGEER